MNPIILVLALTISMSLINVQLGANPLWPAFLTEVSTDSGQEYIIEIYNNGGYENLDGFYLVSTTGSVLVKPGIEVAYQEYRALSQDDFTGSVELAQDQDHVRLYDSDDFLLEEVRYGDGQTDTRAPVPGQSVSAHFTYDPIYGYEWVDFWYLDGSPTFGAENDSVGAMGTITGNVTDRSSGLPIGGAHILCLETSNSTTTNGAGEYSDMSYANKVTLQVTAVGYDTMKTSIGELDLGIGEILIYDVELEPSSGTEPTGNGPGYIPRSHVLSQNFPNPFNPSTVIAFTVPEFERSRMNVLISIHDMRGRLIRKLVDDYRVPGSYRISWDGKTDSGVSVNSGVYFYTLRVGRLTSTRKMIVAQ
jgi:hypothetical protein